MSDITVVKSNNEIPSMTDGNLNMLGMQIKISDIIGDKIVDQFMATMTAEQIDAITKVLFDEVFESVMKKEWHENTGNYTEIQSIKFKTEKEKSNSYSWGSHEYTPIYNRAKSTIMTKYAEIIENKVIEYLESDEYKAKADQIAKDIINYAIEGYKEDIIQGIRNRLVLPALCPNPENTDLKQVIQNEIISNQYQNQNQSY